jgi:mitochondrial fission process protein 1
MGGSGEAFRPVVNPRIVTSAYIVSWAYLTGDVAYEGYKTHLFHKNNLITDIDEKTDVGLTVARRAVFQATASVTSPVLEFPLILYGHRRLTFVIL